MVKWSKGASWLILVLCLLGVASYLTTGIRWDGRFDQVEFQITFLDQNSMPIRDVQLEVENEKGERVFFFPITDLSPLRTIKSDESGLMVFHHINSFAPEVGGMCFKLFFMFDVGTCKDPEFVCRFRWREKTLAEMSYKDLQPTQKEEIPYVTRQWEWVSEELELLPKNIRVDGSDPNETLVFIVKKKTIKVNLN